MSSTDRQKESSKNWYRKNREKVLNQKKEKRLKDLESVKKYQRDWYHANREKMIQYMRDRRRRNQASEYTCKICNLDYPFTEMRGEMCYLCKEEGEQNKPGRSFEKVKKCKTR